MSRCGILFYVYFYARKNIAIYVMSYQGKSLPLSVVMMNENENEDENEDDTTKL